ncbi:MAG: threonine synthase [Saprospiraceae bacterium]|nr:threonine synthase [Saprospiraceae bacterium]
MIYINTKDASEVVSFRQATLNGLASQGGLYVPKSIPALETEWIDNIENYSDHDIGFHVMRQLIGTESLSDSELKQIVTETLAFDIPLVDLGDRVNVLELFHGPTLAFKDVGARFMSRCLGQFSNEDEVNVLVATSGDTGSAVASGFFGVEGVKVTILFPKGKVSKFQEYQMSSLGHNIIAVEVDGTFDDCQSLVKQAFQDIELNKKYSLSSANSINVARLLPQSLYYFLAYKQMKQRGIGQEIVISVPSGNFGNITAGILAKKMGLPIKRFVAANNANDTFYQYIQTSNWQTKPSVQTISNAMDVGAPSNFDRILYFYNNDYQTICREISSQTYSDDETLKRMKSFYLAKNYVLDPHGAVGLLALEDHLNDSEQGIFLATAHPKKFESVVVQAIPGYPIELIDLNRCKKTLIANNYEAFVGVMGS